MKESRHDTFEDIPAFNWGGWWKERKISSQVSRQTDRNLNRLPQGYKSRALSLQEP